MRFRLALATCLVLLFVWSTPGTIALRTLLALLALALLASRANFSAAWSIVRAAPAPAAFLALITGWLVIQALTISTQTQWALGELRGQWLPALASCAMGLLLGANAGRALTSGKAVLTSIALVLALQVSAAVAYAAWLWLSGSTEPLVLMPLTGGKLEMSIVVNVLLAILAVDIFSRATRRPSLIAVPSGWVFAMLVLALGCGYMADSRNGIIGVIFLSTATVSVFLFERRGRLGTQGLVAAALLLCTVLLTVGAVLHKMDPRWQKFAQSVAIGWDIDSHRSWLDPLNHTYPRLPDDRAVDSSAYVRVAWMHAGLRLIEASPLGFGYGRNAFVHSLRNQYPEAKLGHSHSGWIDLGVGGGIPALLLWAAFLTSLIWLGWRSFSGGNNIDGLLLVLLASGYAGRMVLDSINKDHMLQMFMFFAGLLLVMTRKRQKVGTV